MAKYITLNGSDGNGGLKHFLDDLKSSKFQAASDKYGAIKLGYTQNNKNYPVQLDSNGQAYVNVPWEKITYIYGTGIVSDSNGIKSNLVNFEKSSHEGSYTKATSTDKFYSACQGSNNHLAVFVPWVNNAVTAVGNHYRPSGKDQKNDTNNFYKFSIDAAGHISNFSQVTKQDILNLGISDSGDQIKIEDITYSNLYNLVKNSNLIPGKKYRITDYVTSFENDQYMLGDIKVTSKKNTFKILVKALSASTLSEDAILESDSAMYNIKYCIKNDKTRFSWANSIAGKGVIYYMKDAYGNEVPYDFKSIMFNGRFTFSGASTPGEDATMGSGICDNFIGRYCLTQSSSSMIISNNNIYDLPYNLFIGTPCICNKIGTNSTNNTIKGSNNKIGIYNKNINIAGSDNKIGNSCTDVSLGNSCSNNKIGNNCSDVSLGNSCSNNKIGNSCTDVSLGNSCSNNKIGNSCAKANFGNYCNYNVVVDNNISSGVLFKWYGSDPDSNMKSLDRVENCIFNRYSTKIYLDKFHSPAGDYLDATAGVENLSESYKFNNIEFYIIGSGALGEITSINTNPPAGDNSGDFYDKHAKDTKIENLISAATTTPAPKLFTLSSACVIRTYSEINF